MPLLDADATILLPKEKATVSIQPLWLSVRQGTPVATSQSRTMLSLNPDANILPSSEKATAKAQAVWHLRACRDTPIAES